MAKEVIYDPSAPGPIGSYSLVIQAGNRLFISGQIATGPSACQIITSNTTGETAKLMKNLSEILTSACIDFSHVVKSTVFLEDMNNFLPVNEVYAKIFPNLPDANETVGESRFPRDVNAEISCNAVC